jgi:DNA-binding response OmpR family regulator
MIDRSPVILCVEDDPDTQEMLRILLKERGYQFEAASNCADALRVMREKKIALLALDNWLPDGTGIDLCKQVRKFDKNLPIIFVSGSVHDDERQEALQSGANVFLTKPLVFNEFFALIGNYAPV